MQGLIHNNGDIYNVQCRYGTARHESIMGLRNKLEEYGKMKGANKDEKGKHIIH